MPKHDPTKLPLPVGDTGPRPSTWLLGTPRVHSPSGISIGSSVLAPLTLTALGVCVCVCLCVCLSQLRALQKRLNRSRCRSRYGLGGHAHTHTHTALCPGLPGWAGTRKVKPIWILLKQETVSGSGISWAICKSAPHSRQITMPAPNTQFFTGRMPFLPSNQQRQSTEGWVDTHTYTIK